MAKCKHKHEKQKCNACRNKHEVRVNIDHGQAMLQMTRNGYQWQSITFDTDEEATALIKALVDYLYNKQQGQKS